MYVMYVSVIATAYTVWASKMEFELGRLQMILSKRFFCLFLKFIFMEFCPFFIFTISYEYKRRNGKSWQLVYQIEARIL